MEYGTTRVPPYPGTQDEILLQELVLWRTPALRGRGFRLLSIPLPRQNSVKLCHSAAHYLLINSFALNLSYGLLRFFFVLFCFSHSCEFREILFLAPVQKRLSRFGCPFFNLYFLFTLHSLYIVYFLSHRTVLFINWNMMAENTHQWLVASAATLTGVASVVILHWHFDILAPLEGQRHSKHVARRAESAAEAAAEIRPGTPCGRYMPERRQDAPRSSRSLRPRPYTGRDSPTPRRAPRPTLADAVTQTNRHWFSDECATQTVDIPLPLAPLAPLETCASAPCISPIDSPAETGPREGGLPGLPGVLLSPNISEATVELSPRSAYGNGLPNLLLSQAERQLQFLVGEINADPSNPRSWMCLYRYLREMPHCAVMEISKRGSFPLLSKAIAAKGDHQLLLEPLEEEVHALLRGTSTLTDEHFGWKGSSIVLVHDDAGKPDFGRFQEYIISDSDSDLTPRETAAQQLLAVLQRYRHLLHMGVATQCPENPAPDLTAFADKPVPYPESIRSTVSQGLSISAMSRRGTTASAPVPEDLDTSSEASVADVLESIQHLRRSELFESLHRQPEAREFAACFAQLAAVAQRLHVSRDSSGSPSTPIRVAVEEDVQQRSCSHLSTPRKSHGAAVRPRASPLPPTQLRSCSSAGRVSPIKSGGKVLSPRPGAPSPLVHTNPSPRPVASPRNASRNVFQRLYTPPTTPRYEVGPPVMVDGTVQKGLLSLPRGPLEIRAMTPSL
eukprot:gene13266-9109_t